MPRFSANLGFLWTDLSLPDAIRAAHGAGFDAVECHWPYETPSHEVKAALEETKLPMLGLNTVRGNVAGGENGLSALADREAEARRAIDQAVAYALEINAKAIHVMAGNARGSAAHETFVSNLQYALEQTSQNEITLLIEPLNRNDAPDYFLRSTDQAIEIISEIGSPDLRLMFDCYHVGRNEGDVITRFKALQSYIGHVQFASVPDRAAPDTGELDYRAIFKAIDAAGWTAPLGAEYKPGAPTDQTLGWMASFGTAQAESS